MELLEIFITFISLLGVYIIYPLITNRFDNNKYELSKKKAYDKIEEIFYEKYSDSKFWTDEIVEAINENDHNKMVSILNKDDSIIKKYKLDKYDNELKLITNIKRKPKNINNNYNNFGNLLNDLEVELSKPKPPKSRIIREGEL